MRGPVKPDHCSGLVRRVKAGRRVIFVRSNQLSRIGLEIFGLPLTMAPPGPEIFAADVLVDAADRPSAKDRVAKTIHP